ncbi:CRTAC1 family protein [uncultured Draconibacterium sp.]|uniref:CRTAC1 family protein n=1 Tax=uncultured Draconibacterium sp. TaxID=1573823 RepID=UPI003217822A
MRKSKFFFILFLIFSPTLIFAQKKSEVFADVTKSAGIDFVYNFGDHTYVNIVESSGSGITVFDFNNDGLMDIYLMNGTYLDGISTEDGKEFSNTPNELYKNNGDGTFTEMAVKVGVDDRHWSMAAGAIDIDKDGFDDLFLLNYGPNIFYHNNGDGTFTDITGKLGLEGPAELNGFTKWSIGVSFWDYNNDNRLDAMVGNFLAFDPEYISTQTPGMMPHPSEYKGQASMLYEQQADGSFKDVSAKNKLFYPDSKCMGLTVYDFDNDGDMDILQANDHQKNFLFSNENGNYREIGIERGVAVNSHGQPTGSMHGTIGDIDNDGDLDILVGDLKYGALYRNLGNGFYEDVTEVSGVAASFSGKGSWGTAFIDFDNDGDLDIVSANGTAEELILQYPVLLENDGNGRFKDLGKEYGSYFTTKRSGRGLVVLDYDNDGNMDILISHVDLKGEPALLKNNGTNNNHWLGLKLVGENGPASAIAARVSLTVGGKDRVFINQWTNAYLSNSDPRIHIGLGNVNKVDELEVKWSDGKTEVFKNLVTDKYQILKQGKGITEK